MEKIVFFSKPKLLNKVLQKNLWGTGLFPLVLGYGYAITLAQGEGPAAVCLFPGAAIACPLEGERLADKESFIFHIQARTAEPREVIEKWLTLIARAIKGEKVALPLLGPDQVDKELMKLDSDFLEACKGILSRDPKKARAAMEKAITIDCEIQLILKGLEEIEPFGYEGPEPLPFQPKNKLLPFLEIGLKNGRNIERLIRIKNRINLLENA